MTDCNAAHDDGHSAPDPMAQWRENRDPGWYKDIGYALQDVLRSHRYAYENKGCKPDDPGWHACSCGEWEGYWSSFHPHVTDHLRKVTEAVAESERAVEKDAVDPDAFGAAGYLLRPPAENNAGLRATLLAVLMDEYGGDAEDWTAMRSLDRVVRAVKASVIPPATPPDCECAMTEASFHACPLHGEKGICADCGTPWIDHPSTCPIPPATDRGASDA